MPPQNFSEIGTSGLERYAGVITEEQFIPGLHGRQAILTYKEMRENNSIVGAVLFAIDNLLRQTEWRVDPFSEDGQHVEDSEFVKECMDDMSATWPDTISEILSMLEYGWAYHEIVYKRRLGPNEDDPSKNSKHNDSKIGWRKFPLRAQETLDRWKLDDDGGVQAMVQKAPPDYIERIIPIKSALLFRTTTRKNNPEGRSLLRNAYQPYYYMKRIMEIEGVGIERDLAGLPFAKVDPDIMSDKASPEQKAMLARIIDIVTRVRRDAMEGIVFPSLYDGNGNALYSFELLNSGGSRQFDTSAIIERYSRHIAMTVLADFILLGHEGVGSYALSADKTDLFKTALGTILDIIKETFNRYAVPRLFALNGFDLEELPTIEWNPIGDVDLNNIGTFIAACVSAGMSFNDPKTVEWARKLMNAPELDEEDLVPEELPEPPPPRSKSPTGTTEGDQSKPGAEEDAPS